MDIKVEEIAGRVKISIANSGVRISNEIAEQLMKPFFNTKNRRHEPSLGLSLSKDIIELHLGQLTYDREAVYTTFVLELPVATKV